MAEDDLSHLARQNSIGTGTLKAEHAIAKPVLCDVASITKVLPKLKPLKEGFALGDLNVSGN